MVPGRASLRQGCPSRGRGRRDRRRSGAGGTRGGHGQHGGTPGGYRPRRGKLVPSGTEPVPCGCSRSPGTIYRGARFSIFYFRSPKPKKDKKQQNTPNLQTKATRNRELTELRIPGFRARRGRKRSRLCARAHPPDETATAKRRAWTLRTASRQATTTRTPSKAATRTARLRHARPRRVGRSLTSQGRPGGRRTQMSMPSVGSQHLARRPTREACRGTSLPTRPSPSTTAARGTTARTPAPRTKSSSRST